MRLFERQLVALKEQNERIGKMSIQDVRRDDREVINKYLRSTDIVGAKPIPARKVQ